MAFLLDGAFFTKSMAEAISQVFPDSEYTFSNRDGYPHVVDVIRHSLVIGLYNALQSVRVTVRLDQQGQWTDEILADKALLLLFPEMSGKDAAPAIWHSKRDVVPIVVRYLRMFLDKSELLGDTQAQWAHIRQLFEQNRGNQKPAQGESSEQFGNRVVTEISKAWRYRHADDLADWLDACRIYDCQLPILERIRAEARLWWMSQGPMTF